jgi:broad specificity phosphatase PhoE
MSTPQTLPRVVLVRHGRTEWSVAGKHTGRSDIPLLAEGEADARALSRRLAGLWPSGVLTSPSSRARTTCELAGFAAEAVVDGDLAEWDYGQFEGRRTAEILQERPDWRLFHDGCPGGESPEVIAARADRVVARLRTRAGTTLVFSSGHLLRVLAVRWQGLPVACGAGLALDTASISVLGYETTLERPVINGWNRTDRSW